MIINFVVPMMGDKFWMLSFIVDKAIKSKNEWLRVWASSKLDIDYFMGKKKKKNLTKRQCSQMHTINTEHGKGKKDREKVNKINQGSITKIQKNT